MRLYKKRNEDIYGVWLAFFSHHGSLSYTHSTLQFAIHLPYFISRAIRQGAFGDGPHFAEENAKTSLRSPALRCGGQHATAGLRTPWPVHALP